MMPRLLAAVQAHAQMNEERESTFFVFLSCFSINLLAFYHDCLSLIGDATHCIHVL